jgi:hypothetical protein
MRGYLTALALALPCAFGMAPAAAQSSGETGGPAAEEPLTAEKIIEVARERLRPVGVRRPCKPPETPNEIVVCAPDPDEQRIESPTDEAIRRGESAGDSVPRAPNVDGPGIFQGKGMKIGKDPEPPLIVDLTNEPQPLSEEDARRVYRVEDGPPREEPPIPEAEASSAP